MSRVCEIALSRDGAHNLEEPTVHSLGEVGEFNDRIIRRRCGIARQMVLRFSVTDPVRVDVFELVLEIE